MIKAVNLNSQLFYIHKIIDFSLSHTSAIQKISDEN